jgi:hypothetical protein
MQYTNPPAGEAELGQVFVLIKDTNHAADGFSSRLVVTCMHA